MIINDAGTVALSGETTRNVMAHFRVQYLQPDAALSSSCQCRAGDVARPPVINILFARASRRDKFLPLTAQLPAFQCHFSLPFICMDIQFYNPIWYE